MASPALAGPFEWVWVSEGGVGVAVVGRVVDGQPRRAVVGGAAAALDHLEYATLEYVDWFNHRRILEPIGDIPPTEREANYYSQQSPAPLAGLKQTSLR